MYDSKFSKVGSEITIIPQFQQTSVFTGADVFATPDDGFAYAEAINQHEFVQPFHADGTKNGTEIQMG
jgi:hypothetical protein